MNDIDKGQESIDAMTGALEQLFESLCRLYTADIDGMRFLADEIRKQANRSAALASAMDVLIERVKRGAE